MGWRIALSCLILLSGCAPALTKAAERENLNMLKQRVIEGQLAPCDDKVGIFWNLELEINNRLKELE